METLNLLDFLNTSKNFYALDYAFCDRGLINFLDLMVEDEQFTRFVDLGIVYVKPLGEMKYVVIDGLHRLVSLSLLLHAICECYKKTTPRNEKAIRTIRSKYLIKANKSMKLCLNTKDNEIYTKIINGEKLSGIEKNSYLFRLLHGYWVNIKESGYHASNIFSILQKIKITLIEVNDVPVRDIYYNANRGRKLNQLALIADYMKEKKLSDEWKDFIKECFNQENDINLFFKDFFVTKFNFKEYDENRLYERFVNYFETMAQYLPNDKVFSKIKSTALLYKNMLNIDFENPNIRQAFINLNKHDGDDTLAYILGVYEDYVSNSISESIFIEILNTIDEYLVNRQTKGKNIDFNELVQYLNAFITCK